MKKILLVEDTAHLAEEVADILQLEGFAVTIATNGAHALEIVDSVKPDLIITDLLMPKIDGFELIRQLRSRAEFFPIPIIALSAKTADEDRRLAIKIGADNFLQKPCKAHELVGTIRSLLK